MKVRDSSEKAVVVSPPPAPWDIDCSKDEPMTKQEFKKDCDVNEIVKRCVRMGVPLPGADVQAVFADVSSIPDYAELTRRLGAAQDAFASLPAEVRLEFGNSPDLLLAAMQDPKQWARLRELGILAPEKAPVPPSAPPPPAASAAPSAVSPPPAVAPGS